MSNDVETVGVDDLLSRLVFFPVMFDESAQLIWNVIFQFPSNQGQNESLVWWRYATSDAAVHAIGCDLETKMRERKPDRRYVGSLTATANEIIGVKNQNGHGFRLQHEPHEAQHHVGLYFQIANGKPLTKNDKSELKDMLREVFHKRGFKEHTCTD